MSGKKKSLFFSWYKIFWNKLDYLKIDSISLKHEWFLNPRKYLFHKIIYIQASTYVFGGMCDV